MAEWSIASDCKSDAFGLRRFESCPAHQQQKIGALATPIFVVSIYKDRMRTLEGSGIGSEEKNEMKIHS